MISVIYDNEEYTPPYHTLTVGDHIARCYIKLGLYDEAVKWIWKDYEHICKNAKHYNKKEHIEAPLLRGCTFGFFGESMDVKRHMSYLQYCPDSFGFGVYMRLQKLKTVSPSHVVFEVFYQRDLAGNIGTTF